MKRSERITVWRVSEAAAITCALASSKHWTR